eukprot:3821002-Pleurochrysis_carterae.AAC.1
MDMDTFAETPYGDWFRISIHKPYVAVDLKLTRLRWPIGHPKLVELSNTPYPKDMQAPFLAEERLHLRFAHPCEYKQGNAYYSAMQREVNCDSDTSGGRRACPIDFYLWVPAEADEGQTSLDGMNTTVAGERRRKKRRRTQEEKGTQAHEPCVEVGFAPG